MRPKKSVSGIFKSPTHIITRVDTRYDDKRVPYRATLTKSKLLTRGTQHTLVNEAVNNPIYIGRYFECVWNALVLSHDCHIRTAIQSYACNVKSDCKLVVHVHA